MINKFHIDLAKEYGLFEAILLDNFAFWIDKNDKNETNQFDGNTWTYNTIKAFREMFPYVSEKKIRNALNHLEEEGLIITGNYNKSAYDRTKWYAFTPKGRMLLVNKGYSIWSKGQMEMDDRANQFGQKGEPIPSITTSITTDSNTEYIHAQADKKLKPSKLEAEFEALWKLYPKKQGKDTARKKYEIARRDGVTYEEVEEGIKAYVDYIEANDTDTQYVKQGSTFFSQRAWQDDWSVRAKLSGNPFLDLLKEGMF